MDLLHEIRNTATRIHDLATSEGIEAAIGHIVAAERHLDRARKETDDYLYNDVIYRANQAFEGMLKEAYRVLEEDPGAMSAYEIERFFAEEKRLAPRVMDQFRRYRKEWRNPSTHDHTLLFSEQEALLAIVSVSAFARILLDQVVEEFAARDERQTTSGKGSKIRSQIENYQKLSLCDKISQLLILFSDDPSVFGTEDNAVSLSESEILGRLAGFLNSVDENLLIEREKSIGGVRPLRPDMVISDQDDDVILLEVWRRSEKRRGIFESRAQMIRYLQVSGLSCGVVYVPPEHSGRIMHARKNREVMGVIIVVEPDAAGELSARIEKTSRQGEED